MVILCNEYLNGIVDQPGDQPIRVFHTMFMNSFERIIIEMQQQYGIDLSNIRLHFLTENIPCIGPRCTKSKIEIHDSFMSMLWGLCYGIYTRTPLRSDVDQNEREIAENVLDYAIGILTKYTDWDKNKLPNPEIYSKDQKNTVGRTSAVFVYAYNFIFYHEFAHIVLQHFNGRKHLSALEMEFEADSFACKHVIQNTNSTEHQIIGKVGIIMALCSIIFSTYDLKGGNVHPDPHNRLGSIMVKIFENSVDAVEGTHNFIWGLSSWCLIEWGMKFNAFFKLFPGSFNGDLENAFYQSLSKLENLQRERNVVIPNIETKYTIGEKVIHMENGVKVTVENEFICNSNHFNTYQIRFETGLVMFVSSDDICREGSEWDFRIKEWKEEMNRRGEKSISIGIDKNGELQCFYHTAKHYEIILEHPEVSFKWAWGEPSL